MLKGRLPILAAALCGALAAIPLAAATATPARTNKATTKASAAATRSAWPGETLSGKVTLVEPDQKLLVVKASDGVPFDIRVTPQTRIKSGSQMLALKDLKQDLNKEASVSFIPESRGDVAKSIQID